jgi:hypothetical protein
MRKFSWLALLVMVAAGCNQADTSSQKAGVGDGGGGDSSLRTASAPAEKAPATAEVVPTAAEAASVQAAVEAVGASRPAPRPVAENVPAGEARPDRAQVLATLQQRLARLDSVIVCYHTHVTYPPLRPGEQGITRPEGANYQFIRVTGTRDWKKLFMRLGDRYRYEDKITGVEGAVQGPDWWPDTDMQIRVYTPESTESLGFDREGQTTRGVVDEHRGLPQPEIEFALGLRGHEQTDVLQPDFLAGMRLDVPPTGDEVTLSTVDNEKCTHTWTFLLSEGFALKRYVRTSPPGSHVEYVATMGDFREVDGMIMPHSMVFTSTTVLGGADRVNYKVEATVDSYAIGSDRNTADLYAIRWPDGTRLYDRRAARRAAAEAAATQAAATQAAASQPRTRSQPASAPAE